MQHPFLFHVFQFTPDLLATIFTVFHVKKSLLRGLGPLVQYVMLLLRPGRLRATVSHTYLKAIESYVGPLHGGDGQTYIYHV